MVIWWLWRRRSQLAWLSLLTCYWAGRWLATYFRLGGGGACLVLPDSCLRFRRTCLGRGNRAGGPWLEDCGGQAAFLVGLGCLAGGGDRWWLRRRQDLRYESPCGSFD